MKEKFRPSKKWYKIYKILYCLLNKKKNNDSCLEIKNMRSILIAYPHLLGDIVMLIPFIRICRYLCPNTRIDLVADRYAKTILEPLSIIDNFYDFGSTSGMHGARQLLNNIRTVNRTISTINETSNYDLIIDPFCDFGASYLVDRINAKHKVGFDFFGFDYLYTYTVKHNSSISHIVDDMIYMLQSLTSIDLKHTRKFPDMVLSKIQEKYIEQYKGELEKYSRVIGIHPGASQLSKRWGNYSQLISDIGMQYKNILFLIFQGPGEEQVVSDIVKNIKLTSCEYMIINESLDKYLAILSLCDLVICNDSSCGHFAVAFHVDSIIIFGQGVPEYISPRNDKCIVDIVDVKDIDCKPCYKNLCPRGTLECIRKIDYETVLLKVKRILDGKK